MCSVLISVQLGTSMLLHLRSNTPSMVWQVVIPEGARWYLRRSTPVGKKSLSCLALESLWWSEHCKSDRARHAFSLPLECCDCLDWNQISTEKTYHNCTRHSSLMRVNSSFSWITSCVQLSCSCRIRFTLIFYYARKKVRIRHIWSCRTLYSTELEVKLLPTECTRSQHLYQ